VNWWILVPAIFLCYAACATMAGVWFVRSGEAWTEATTDCSDFPSGCLASVLWPLTMWYLLGKRIVNHLEAKDAAREAKAEEEADLKRKQEELLASEGIKL
jgi:hypothetical protein